VPLIKPSIIIELASTRITKLEVEIVGQVIAITEAVTSLAIAEAKFSLQRSTNPQFFKEWYEHLPSLADSERTVLDRIRQRYLYHRNEDSPLEETIKLLLVSPLFELAGFYDPPFKLRTEASVELTLEEIPQEILRGRIDALVTYTHPQKGTLWVVVLEAKRSHISVWSALPQALTYAMANPMPKTPVFVMITNGDEIAFAKLVLGSLTEYDVSTAYSLLPLRNELYQVLAVLKQVSAAIAPSLERL
jgi:hypothetical protein